MLKRAFMVVAVFTLSGLAAAQAQQVPQVPKLGFSVTGSYANTPYLSGGRSNLYGWEATVEGFRLKPFLTFVLDGSGHYGWNPFPISCVTVNIVCNPGPPDSRVREYDLLAGPQVSVIRGRYRPFVHVLGGAGRVTMTTPGFFDDSLNWMIAAGGGSDYAWKGPLSFRAQGDVIRKNFFGDTQYGIRVSIGFSIRIF